MKTKILASLCILFFLGACKSPSASIPHDYTVVGRAANGNTGVSISNVTIEVGKMGYGQPEAQTHTDYQGRYTLNFRIIHTRSYLIWAHKDGYEGSVGEDVLNHGFEDTTRTQTIDFKLYPKSD